MSKKVVTKVIGKPVKVKGGWCVRLEVSRAGVSEQLDFFFDSKEDAESIEAGKSFITF